MFEGRKTSFKIISLIFGFVILLSGCAGSQAQYNRAAATPVSIPDPIEPWNRGMTKLNTVLDVVLLDPLALGYNAILPKTVRNGIGNFLTNLRTPLYFANNLLQGDFGDAGVSAARFVMNTTVGIGGILDVAATQGLNPETEDFGQTLAVWGFSDGFYLVWPIFGPSSLRDTLGTGVDSYVDPVRLIAFDGDEKWIYYTRNGIEALHNKAGVVDMLRDLRKNSLDYYTALKSIYEQRRAALIRDHSYETLGVSTPMGYTGYGLYEEFY